LTKRQAALDPNVTVANVAEALKLVMHASDVRVAIHPSQHAALAEVLPRLKLQWPTLEHVEIVADAAVAPGGCRIFTAHGEVDGGLDTQLNLIVADLLPDHQEHVA
jgi:flagellar assembly protein FliH